MKQHLALLLHQHASSLQLHAHFIAGMAPCTTQWPHDVMRVLCQRVQACVQVGEQFVTS